MSLLIQPAAAVDASVIDITITAGENLAIRDVVRTSQGALGETGGRAYKADADLPAESTLGWIFGFATEAITSGNEGSIRIAGKLGGFSGLAVGALQYISETDGEITETEPANSLLMGVAVSTTEILINTRGSNDLVAGAGGTKGYIAGGATASGYQATAERITFSTEVTVTQTTANLSLARHGPAGLNGGSTFGYFSGGYSTAVTVNTTDRLVFSGDYTVAQTSANLSAARYNAASVSEGSVKGYILGSESPPGTDVATADKITFSTHIATAQTTANLSLARRSLAGMNGGATKGYVAGGYTISNYVATGDIITFSTDSTAAATTVNLSQARFSLSGLSEGETKGYWQGGNSAAIVNTGDKITFSSDTTVAATTANLSVGRQSMVGVSEGDSKGFVLGGYSASAKSVISDKITFSTDSSAAATSANLTVARDKYGGLSDVVS